MAGQVAQAMDNLESVLAEGDLSLTDVVRFDVYTTDLRALLAAAHVYGARFAEHGLLPVGGILAEVSALAMPGLMVELVAVASR
jgi:enamine deaminase RidA (YjgF/YER057c/UK114 family)